MSCFTCRSSRFQAVTRAMAKAASAQWRALGGSETAQNWAAREEVCARCPMRVTVRGVAYCGTPFLQKIDREPTIDGCGCPVRAKAKSPDEHCPLKAYQPTFHESDNAACGCKWCAGAATRQRALNSTVI